MSKDVAIGVKKSRDFRKFPALGNNDLLKHLKELYGEHAANGCDRAIRKLEAFAI